MTRVNWPLVAMCSLIVAGPIFLMWRDHARRCVRYERSYSNQRCASDGGRANGAYNRACSRAVCLERADGSEP